MLSIEVTCTFNGSSVDEVTLGCLVAGLQIPALRCALGVRDAAAVEALLQASGGATASGRADAAAEVAGT